LRYKAFEFLKETFMKRSKSFAALSLAFLTTLSASAQTFDIKSAKSDLFIQVTKSGDLRKFELCSKRKGPESCKPLGFREWYSVKELERQRLQEQAEGAVSVVGTAAVLVISYFTILVPAAATSAAVGLSGYGTATVIGTSTVASTAYYTLSKLGPIEQMKQQYLLRSDVINDEQVEVKGANDAKIKEIADRLEVVLNKI
jgi:hypothetical protein